MAGLLSPQAQQKVAALKEMEGKVQHVHGLVERFAMVARDERKAEQLSMPLKRAFGKLKLALMGHGLDTMAQLAGSLEIAAGRGGSQTNKARVLREGVGSLRFQVEQEGRKVVQEDQGRGPAEPDAARGAQPPPG